MKELQEGVSSLAERQKHIRFADQAENSWDAVNKYLGYSFANNEEDDRKLELSDRSAGVKKHRKAAANAQKPMRFPGYRADYGYSSRRYEEFGPQRSYQEVEFQGYGQQFLPKRMMPYRKQRGPCYQCGQLGHIKATCPNAILQSKSIL